MPANRLAEQFCKLAMNRATGTRSSCLGRGSRVRARIVPAAPRHRKGRFTAGVTLGILITLPAVKTPR